MKADWTEYLHSIRRRELDILFSHLPAGKAHENALELGAGDGFQSEILAEQSRHLVATDLNPNRLRKDSSGNIEYRICDAELIDSYFEEKTFDFIFSSNLLEHLPNPEKALLGIHRILKDDGITVHIVPSPFYKLAQILLFYPNLIITRMETLFSAESSCKYIKEKLHRYLLGKDSPERSGASHFDNNPKLSNARNRSPLVRLLWPKPHGVCRNHIDEFAAWHRSRWVELFRNTGFEIESVIRGPAFSGYGFGCNRCRRILEKAGLASEMMLVFRKRTS